MIVGLSVNESTFNDYGWRFAFLIAAPLALFALYLRYGLEEPATYQKADRG